MKLEMDKNMMKWLPTALIMIAAVLLIISANMLYGTIDETYWEMHLDAPQYEYRGGLDILVYIDRMEGKDPEFDDLREINELNHYIGMRDLDEAAVLEREIAIPTIKLFSVLLIVAAVYIILQHLAFAYTPQNLSELSGLMRPFAWFFRLRELKFLPWLLVFPAMLFPAVFMLDLYYWLDNSGQNLDLTAPFSSSIHPFTPNMQGEGEIGQFHTVSDMADGWYTASNASVLILIAIVLGLVHFGLVQFNAYKVRQANEEVKDSANS